MNDLGVSGSPEFIALWRKVCDEQKLSEKQWVAELRAKGFKAAHPNDGWVNRKDNEVSLVYPQFNDGVSIGDLVMLGWPNDKDCRPVRIIGVRKGLISFDPSRIMYYKFEDVQEINNDNA